MDRNEILCILSNKIGKLNSKLCSKIQNCRNLNSIQLDIYNTWKKDFLECNTIKEMYYWIKHQLTEKPKCPTCGKKIKFQECCSIYPTHCCCTCAQLDKNVRDKLENTMLENYGVKNSMHSDFFKQKIIDTSIKKFGAKNIFCTQQCKDKIKKTNIKKYGVENPHQNSVIKNKFNQTMKQKYGHEFPTQNYDIRLKGQHKYTYNNQKFDSSLEIAYYIYLMDNNIKFIYNPKVDFTYNYNNKIYNYFPDFFLIESKRYVEIKGNQFFKKDGTMCNPYDHSMDLKYEAKHQCMIRNNVKIILESDMNDIKNHIKNKFGSYDYLKNNFKNKEF